MSDPMKMTDVERERQRVVSSGSRARLVEKHQSKIESALSAFSTAYASAGCGFGFQKQPRKLVWELQLDSPDTIGTGTLSVISQGSNAVSLTIASSTGTVSQAIEVTPLNTFPDRLETAATHAVHEFAVGVPKVLKG